LGDFVAFPFKVVWALATGWITFLIRKLPQMDVHVEAVLSGAIALGLLVLVVHLLMRKFFNRSAQEDSPARTWRFRWTAAAVSVVMLLFAAGISTIGVTHQTSWMFTSGEKIVEVSDSDRLWNVARRADSANNLKQLGLAANMYYNDYNALPPATTFDKNGRALHGWQTMLIPYLEATAFYSRIKFDKPWDHDENRSAFQIKFRTFWAQSGAKDIDSKGYYLTNYAGNVHALSGDRDRPIQSFPQGSSNVILAGEISTNLKPWGYPLNVRDPKLGLKKSANGFGGPWKSGTQFVMADGSIRIISSNADPEFLQMIAQPDGP
jgi:hypothetical protein